MTTKSSNQILVGNVVSTKMAKTIVLEVRTRKRHPKYHKSYTVSKRLQAHVEDGEYAVGDKVSVISVKPISKAKRFKVISKV